MWEQFIVRSIVGVSERKPIVLSGFVGFPDGDVNRSVSLSWVRRGSLPLS